MLVFSVPLEDGKKLFIGYCFRRVLYERPCDVFKGVELRVLFERPCGDVKD